MNKFLDVLCRLKCKINSEYIVIVVEVTFLLFIILFHALPSGHYVNFFPINGTFQNYNPVRRLLDGQVPYRDFIDYLGLGHLYIGALITQILGGTYQSSLVAFSFLTFSGLAMLSLVIGQVIFNNWKKSICVSNFFLIVLIAKPFFFVNNVVAFQDVLDALTAALETGNSARFVRGLILPITTALMLLLTRIYSANKDWFNKKNVSWSFKIITGMIAGLAFIWSNDYGISVWLCLILMVVYVSFVRNRRVRLVVQDGILVTIGSAISIFTLVEIATLGHFNNWVKVTFGTGGYQSWYYNSPKSFYLSDVDFSFVMLVQASITVVYLIKLFIKKGTDEAVVRYGVLAFVNMTCFCAVNEYQLLSGGGCREVALSTLFLTVFYELIGTLMDIFAKWELEDKIILTISIICVAWILSTIKEEFVFKFTTEKDGEYVESMGGNMTYLYPDMQSAHEFLNGDEFFSTYASAQEVYENTFQPTGIDYIIHVLGDEQRDAYLNQFLNGDFKYTVTIRKDFTDWEYWIERANWFFYRELYENWHPKFSNTYETYWVRNDAGTKNMLLDDFEVQVEYVDDSTAKLVIETDENITGIADIYIDYEIEKRLERKLTKLQLQRMLKVQNTVVHAGDSFYESNYLRPVSTEYIPMPIENGYGELMLSSLPERTTTFCLNEVKCKKIYTVYGD